MKTSTLCLGLATMALLLVFSVTVLYAQGPGPAGTLPQPASLVGTAFTYQGQLLRDGAPVSASCQVEFRLYDDAASGNQVGSAVMLTVPVVSGRFAAAPDFGAAFGGQARWLGIRVQCPSDAGFADLGRQALTAAPYALYSLSGSATSLQGWPVSSAAPASGQALKWDGSAWSPAADRTGWDLAGNAGTSPSTNFLGTTDNASLTVQVNGTIALRVAPTAGTPNLLAGYDGNSVSAGVLGAVVAGGGQPGAPNGLLGSYSVVGGGSANTAGLYADVAGGYSNTASNSYAVVTGGYSNTASGSYGFVGGGQGNRAGGSWSAVAGGRGNEAGQSQGFVGGGANNDAGLSAFVGGGVENAASGGNSTVAGGYRNLATSLYGFVGGGSGNAVYSSYGFVGGGLANAVSASYGFVGGGSGNAASGEWSVVAGGQDNRTAALHAFVGGGQGNTAAGSSSMVGGGYGNTATAISSVVAGGWGNGVDGKSAVVGGGSSNLASGWYSVVGGGSWNKTGVNADYAVVPGGAHNEATADYSLAAGSYARSAHDGAFVWADASAATPFTSTAQNQFLVRAQGGVGVNTASPQATLDVSGSARLGRIGTEIENLQAGTAMLGQGGEGTNIFTVTFPQSYSAAPRVVVSLRGDNEGYGDLFVITTRRVITSGFQVNVYRIDVPGGDWQQYLQADWIAWQ